MARVIEARALLTAKDEASQKILALSKRIDQMSRAQKTWAQGSDIARQAAKVDAMARSYERAGRSAKSAQGMFAAAGMATRAIAPILGGAALVRATRQFAELDRRITRIGITADADQGSIKGLADQIYNLGQSVALPTSDVTTGLETLVAQGRTLKDSLAFLPSVARTAAATGASVDDIAKSADSVGSNFKIAAGQMQDAFDIMAAGGKAGQFELKEMARYLPSLGPAAAAAGIKGKEGLSDMVAMLQIMRKGSGTSEEAATSAQNIFQKMRSEETVKRFKKMNVDLLAGLAKGAKEGKNVITVFEDLVQIATKGDLSKIPNLINDMEFARGIRALMTYRGEWQKLSAEMQRTSKGTVEIDLKRVTNDAQAKLDKLAEMAKHRARQIGEIVANIALPINDKIDEVLKGQSPVVNRVDEWSKHYNADVIAQEELRTGASGTYDANARRLIDARKEFLQRQMIDEQRGRLGAKVGDLEAQRQAIVMDAERQKSGALPSVRPLVDARTGAKLAPIDQQLSTARILRDTLESAVSGVTETLLKQAEASGAIEHVKRLRLNADPTGTMFNRTTPGISSFGFGPGGSRLPDGVGRPISYHQPAPRPESLPKAITISDIQSAFPKFDNLKAFVQEPIPLQPVKLEGKGTVDVRVTVDGPGRVTGMSTTSSGHLSTEGTALIGTFGRN